MYEKQRPVPIPMWSPVPPRTLRDESDTPISEDQRVLLAKPRVDTKGEGSIVSRLGVRREVSFLLGPRDDARAVFAHHAQGRDDGSMLAVDLPRPRKRVELAEDPQYVHYRKAVIDFLYTRQGHVEKAA